MNLKRVSDTISKQQQFDNAVAIYLNVEEKIKKDLEGLGFTKVELSKPEDYDYYVRGRKQILSAKTEAQVLYAFEGVFVRAEADNLDPENLYESKSMMPLLNTLLAGKPLAGFKVKKIQRGGDYVFGHQVRFRITFDVEKPELSSKDLELNNMLKSVDEKFHRYLENLSDKLDVPLRCNDFVSFEESDKVDPASSYRGKYPVYKLLKSYRLEATRNYDKIEEIKHDTKVFSENPFEFEGESYVIVPDRTWIRGLYSIKMLK